MAVVLLEPAELEALLARASEAGAHRALAAVGAVAKPTLGAGDVAAQLGFKQTSSVHALVHEGRLTAIRLSAREWRFRQSDVDEFLEANATKPSRQL